MSTRSISWLTRKARQAATLLTPLSTLRRANSCHSRRRLVRRLIKEPASCLMRISGPKRPLATGATCIVPPYLRVVQAVCAWAAQVSLMQCAAATHRHSHQLRVKSSYAAAACQGPFARTDCLHRCQQWCSCWLAGSTTRGRVTVWGAARCLSAPGCIAPCRHLQIYSQIAHYPWLGATMLAASLMHSNVLWTWCSAPAGMKMQSSGRCCSSKCN